MKQSEVPCASQRGGGLSEKLRAPHSLLLFVSLTSLPRVQTARCGSSLVLYRSFFHRNLPSPPFPLLNLRPSSSSSPHPPHSPVPSLLRGLSPRRDDSQVTFMWVMLHHKYVTPHVLVLLYPMSHLQASIHCLLLRVLSLHQPARHPPAEQNAPPVAVLSSKVVASW